MATPDDTEDQSVVLEFAFDEPPQKLWKAVSEPQLAERWLPSAETTREPISVEDGRRISYAWREDGAPDSVVTFTVDARIDGGSRLTIVHTANVIAVSMSGSSRKRPKAANDHFPLLLAA